MKSIVHTLLYQPLYNLFILILLVMPGHNVGLAIIVLTAIVRIVLIPLKYKSLESQMKMRELQPEIKRLQDQHKGDKQAQSMAMMQLYKDRGANPASGCLPTLIQLPILFVLFYVFKNGFTAEQFKDIYPFITHPESVSTAFLWVKDLTQPDPLYVLPVLTGIAQFFYSKMIMQDMPQTGGANDVSVIISKQMTYVFPVMTVFVAAGFPAALSLYWVVGTLIDWFLQHRGQKHYTNRQTGRVTVSVRSKKRKSESA